MFAAGETVTRLRGTLTGDPYSGIDSAISWTSPASRAIPGCGFDPGTSDEPTQDARNAVITRPTVYAPTGSDVLPGDRLVVRGITYEVKGNPAAWRSPFTGSSPGLVVTLEEVRG